MSTRHARHGALSRIACKIMTLLAGALGSEVLDSEHGPTGGRRLVWESGVG